MESERRDLTSPRRKSSPSFVSLRTAFVTVLCMNVALVVDYTLNQDEKDEIIEVKDMNSVTVPQLAASPEAIQAEAEPICPKRQPGSKPLIGLSGDMKKPSKLSKYPRKYIDEAGGTPVRINPKNFENKKCEIDGLVLVGGKDIPAGKFSEFDHSTVKPLEEGRFDFDKKLIELAEEVRIPILGICLGSQELWVNKGGSLIQDIPSELGINSINHRGLHPVLFSDDSFFSDLYPDDLKKVKSSHHQANDDGKAHGENNPHDVYRVTGSSFDGAVEAIESKNMEEQFTIGIQWHPRGENASKLYKKFVERAGKKND